MEHPVAGRITLYVMAALAEAERALIVERTRAWPSSSSSSSPPRRPSSRHDP